MVNGERSSKHRKLLRFDFFHLKFCSVSRTSQAFTYDNRERSEVKYSCRVVVTLRAPSYHDFKNSGLYKFSTRLHMKLYHWAALLRTT